MKQRYCFTPRVSLTVKWLDSQGEKFYDSAHERYWFECGRDNVHDDVYQKLSQDSSEHNLFLSVFGIPIVLFILASGR